MLVYKYKAQVEAKLHVQKCSKNEPRYTNAGTQKVPFPIRHIRALTSPEPYHGTDGYSRQRTGGNKGRR